MSSSSWLLVPHLGTMAVNGIMRRGKGMRLTTKDLSFAHPVYLSFAVWGAICLLLDAFAVLWVDGGQGRGRRCLPRPPAPTAAVGA
jgi:hypothetical protein